MKIQLPSLPLRATKMRQHNMPNTHRRELLSPETAKITRDQDKTNSITRIALIYATLCIEKDLSSLEPK